MRGSESMKYTFFMSAGITAHDKLYCGAVHILLMPSTNQHAFMAQMIDSKSVLNEVNSHEAGHIGEGS